MKMDWFILFTGEKSGNPGRYKKTGCPYPGITGI
jgi:hypothetical protein